MQAARRLLKLTGAAASASAWLIIVECVRRNPWFDLFRHAFSDLGTSGAVDPWLYNRGLMFVAALLALFSIHMVIGSRSKLEVVGGAYMSTAAVFLALIGAFPGGTRPHTFVSTWFFVQAFLAVLAYGLGKWPRDRVSSAASVAIFSLALTGTLIEWPSVATAEAYEITMLNLATILYAVRDPP